MEQDRNDLEVMDSSQGHMFCLEVFPKRIPVNANLVTRGCSICLFEIEDEDHLFYKCMIAHDIWRRVSWWSKNDFIRHGTLHDILEAGISSNWIGYKRKIMIGVIFSTI
ncbi:hypothetical protein R6Q57_009059 [Mikania cordata]